MISAFYDTRISNSKNFSGLSSSYNMLRRLGRGHIVSCQFREMLLATGLVKMTIFQRRKRGVSGTWITPWSGMPRVHSTMTDRAVFIR